MSFGRYIQEMRLRRDMSQEALGRAADISAATVSRIERGLIEMPARDTVARLAQALGADEKDLLRRAGYWVEDAPAASDTTARFMLVFEQLSETDQRWLLRLAEDALESRAHVGLGFGGGDEPRRVAVAV